MQLSGWLWRAFYWAHTTAGRLWHPTFCRSMGAAKILLAKGTAQVPGKSRQRVSKPGKQRINGIFFAEKTPVYSDWEKGKPIQTSLADFPASPEARFLALFSAFFRRFCPIFGGVHRLRIFRLPVPIDPAPCVPALPPFFSKQREHRVSSPVV